MSVVLVTDARRGAAVSVIRSLIRAGHRVIAADDTALSPGRWSRGVAGFVRYPDPLAHPAAAGEVLARAARNRRVDVVVPTTEPVIGALETPDAAALRPEWCRLAVAEPAALAVARDKQATIELARRLGVPVPASHIVTTVAEAMEATAPGRAEADELGWPIVLKPVASVAATPSVDGDASAHQVKFTVAYAQDRAELERQMARFEGRSAVMLQELCPGEGIGVEALADEGRVVAAFAHRRLREVPITGGASSLREAIPLDPELLAHASALLGALRWSGLAMVEFKLGRHGPRLMEINGRIWGSLPLAVAAGMDFPARAVAQLLDGGSPCGPVDTAYRVGTRSRNVELELVWAGNVVRGAGHGHHRREGLAVAARLLHPGDGYDIWSLRDPVPGLVEMLRLVAKPLAKARNR